MAGLVGNMASAGQQRRRGGNASALVNLAEPGAARRPASRGLRRGGQRFESPQLHHPVLTNSGGFRI